MKCPRCENTNSNRFFKINNEIYCRECIKFKRVNLNTQRITKRKKYTNSNVNYHLDFELSSMQQFISKKLVLNYDENKNSLVLAVCGSGKTEIIFEVIKHALNKGDRVCFCVPRTEIVKELYERIIQSFTNIDIGLCVGGNINNIDAQFIVCTMHQLYRFENNTGFELMIADEVDAYPFYKNKILNEIFIKCTLKNYIKLSATFTAEDIYDEEVLIMNRRYHGKDLPVPKFLLIPKILQKHILIYLIKQMNKKVLVFVPYIALVEEISSFLNLHKIKSKGVHSKSDNIHHTIDSLKKGNIQVIVTTTLLERGITIEDIQVIVYHAQNTVFDQRTLIQIAGRVGRKPSYTSGKIYLLSDRKTKEIEQCIKEINQFNTKNV